ncbi:hypothetical protein PJL18_04084 [Paenarthrobacter nicotinovorans]|nr:hypothetical protein [Paenarthrobacter nicotinovorans]
MALQNLDGDRLGQRCQLQCQPLLRQPGSVFRLDAIHDARPLAMRPGVDRPIPFPLHQEPGAACVLHGETQDAHVEAADDCQKAAGPALDLSAEERNTQGVRLREGERGKKVLLHEAVFPELIEILRQRAPAVSRGNEFGTESRNELEQHTQGGRIHVVDVVHQQHQLGTGLLVPAFVASPGDGRRIQVAGRSECAGQGAQDMEPWEQALAGPPGAGPLGAGPQDTRGATLDAC